MTRTITGLAVLASVVAAVPLAGAETASARSPYPAQCEMQGGTWVPTEGTYGSGKGYCLYPKPAKKKCFFFYCPEDQSQLPDVRR
jgi:hypothetical protein